MHRFANAKPRRSAIFFSNLVIQASIKRQDSDFPSCHHFPIQHVQRRFLQWIGKKVGTALRYLQDRLFFATQSPAQLLGIFNTMLKPAITSLLLVDGNLAIRKGLSQPYGYDTCPL